jgi:hypothetical protein
MPSHYLEQLAPTPEAQEALKRQLVLQRYNHPKAQADFARKIYKQLFPLGEEMEGPISDEEAITFFQRMAGLDPEYQEMAFIDDNYAKTNLDKALIEMQYGSTSPSFLDKLKASYNTNFAPLLGGGIGALTGGPLGAMFGSQHTAETLPQDAVGWATMGASNRIPAITNFLNRGGGAMRAGKEGLYAAGEGALQRGVSGDSALDLAGLASDFGMGATMGAGMAGAENVMSRGMFGTPSPSTLMHQDVPVSVSSTATGQRGSRTVPGEAMLDVFNNPARFAAIKQQTGVDPSTVTEGAVPLYTKEQEDYIQGLFEKADQSILTEPVSVATPRPQAPIARSAPSGQAPVTPIQITPEKTKTSIEGGTTEYPQLPDIDVRGSRIKTGVESGGSYQKLKELAKSPRTDEMPEVAPVVLGMLGDLRDIFKSGGEETFLKIIEANKLGGSQNNFTTRQARNIPTAAKQLAAAIPGLPEDRAAKLLTTALTYGSSKKTFSPETLKNLVHSVDLEEDELIKELVGPYQPIRVGGVEITKVVEPGKVEFDIPASQKREVASAERLAQQTPLMEQKNLENQQAYEQKLAGWEAREAARAQRIQNFQTKKAALAEKEFAQKTLARLSGKNRPPTAQEMSQAAIQNPEQAIKRTEDLMVAMSKTPGWTPQKEIELRANLLTDFLRELQDPGTFKALLPEGKPGQTQLKPTAVAAVNRAGAPPQGTLAKNAMSYLDYLTGSRKATTQLIDALNTEGLLGEVASQDAPKLSWTIRGHLMNLGTRLHYGQKALDFASDFRRPTPEDARKMKVLREGSKQIGLFGRTSRSESAKQQDSTSVATDILSKIRAMFSGQ